MGVKRAATLAAVLRTAVLLAIPLAAAAQPVAPSRPAPLRPEALDQLLAPVALYPDFLLAHILMAATYPQEVAQAARWAKDNSALAGDHLTAAMRARPWEPTVKALVHYPEVLQMLDGRPEWVRTVGDALLARQREVLMSIQRLRRRAQEFGGLGSTEQRRVKVEGGVILIQPVNPQMASVPVYDPAVAYGTWPYPAYPPDSLSPRAAPAVTGAVAFAAIDWRRGEITIDESLDRYQTRRAGRRSAAWQHDPGHRADVPYADSGTAQRFGEIGAKAAFHGAARGHGTSSQQGSASAGPALAGIADGGFDSAASERGRSSRPGSTAIAPARPPQRTFRTAEEAARALLDAIGKPDPREIASILGPDGRAVLSTGDEVADQIALEGFHATSEQALVLNRPAPGRVIIAVGKDHWPFPIPLVQVTDGWRFDIDAGRREVLSRRIGRNELRAIDVCRVYVTAQREYARVPREPDGVLRFAQRVMSSPGRHDGLYWEVVEGQPPSPLGPLVAAATREGRKPTKAGEPGEPFHGYFYKILTAQGPNAPGGRYGYVINGNMVAGFALVAWPAQYGSSGTMTFVVNHNGIIYEKDLGQKTAGLAAAMTHYDPDQSWRRAQ